jgi:hypothetical protein
MQQVHVQLGLIDTTTGEMLIAPEETIVEVEYTFRQMLEIGKNYGTGLGKMYATNRLSDQQMDSRIIGFVDGMSAVRPLSADEREWLRNDTLTAATNAINDLRWAAAGQLT